ncbi:MAG: hypothetical protein C4329_11065 [Chitinophagaceae bacterium]
MLTATIFFSIVACKKADTSITAPAFAKFNLFNAGDTVYNYSVMSTGNTLKVPVGITNISNVDRKVAITVTSRATAGVQYQALPTTITIPAGKAVDSLEIKGLFAGLANGRKDTLIISIVDGGDVPAATYNKRIRVYMQQFCPVVSTNLIGNYANSTDLYNNNPSSNPNYTANISNWTATSATSATVIIKNLGATSDNGWGPFYPTDPAINPGLTAKLDWSNISNTTVIIPTQNYFNDGSGMSTITGTGTFSSCDQIFRITCTVRYAGNGINYTHVSILRR